MADSDVWPSGGAGGAGFRFRTPVDNFTAANLTQARARRDAGITGADLADFQNDPTLTIILTVSNRDTYESYRQGAWRVNTNAIAGKGDKGDRGPGPTAQEIANALLAGVKPYAQTGGRLIEDTDADPEFIIASEITADFILGIIGLTANQINDIFLGARVTGTGAGRAIVVTQKDGSTISLPVPDTTGTGGGGGGADGRVQSGAIDSAGTTITLTLTTGGLIPISIPAVLRASGLNQAQVQALIDAAEADDLDAADVAAQIRAELVSYRPVASVLGRSVNYQLQLSDRGDTIRLTGGVARTITKPAGTPIGWWARLLNTSTRDMIFDVGVTDRIVGHGQTFVVKPNKSATVQFLGTATWALLVEPVDLNDAPGGLQRVLVVSPGQISKGSLPATFELNLYVVAGIYTDITKAAVSLGGIEQTIAVVFSDNTVKLSIDVPVSVAIGNVLNGRDDGATEPVVVRLLTAGDLERDVVQADLRVLPAVAAGGGGADNTARAAAAANMDRLDAIDPILAAARTQSAAALARTQRLRPVSQYVHLGGAQVVYVEWKPVVAVPNNAPLVVNVGGVAVAGVVSPEAVAAGDRQGIIIGLTLNAANAGSLDRTANTLEGHVEIQITFGGVVDSCWMGVKPFEGWRQLAGVSPYTLRASDTEVRIVHSAQTAEIEQQILRARFTAATKLYLHETSNITNAITGNRRAQSVAVDASIDGNQLTISSDQYAGNILAVYAR